MGTLLEVTVWEADTARAREALAAARAAVFRVDTLMSLYKEESELSVVNRRAGSGDATTLSPETAEVLAAALDYAARTGGAIDVTVGPLVDVWGFYRHEGRIPPAEVLDSARALVGYERIEFDPATRAVRLPAPGMRLDFGAIAKGYAVDLAVVALRRRGIRRGKVDLGGNLRFFGSPPEDGAWSVGLRDPRRPEEILAVVALDSGAVATSGDYEQFFVHDGVRYSHLMDPRTGRPARGVASVSVVAPTGLAADALSTALFVLGPGRGCGVAAGVPGVEALWILDAGADGAREAGGAFAPIRFTPGLEGVLAFYVEDPAALSAVRPCGSAAPTP
ncbi:MAG TPA: FAD:protein FMN transferase [Longimicrobiales bacterium]